MADPITSRVIDAETISGDAIITFSNGTSVLYSAALLLSIINQAAKLHSQPKAVSR